MGGELANCLPCRRHELRFSRRLKPLHHNTDRCFATHAGRNVFRIDLYRSTFDFLWSVSNPCIAKRSRVRRQAVPVPAENDEGIVGTYPVENMPVWQTRFGEALLVELQPQQPFAGLKRGRFSGEDADDLFYGGYLAKIRIYLENGKHDGVKMGVNETREYAATFAVDLADGAPPPRKPSPCVRFISHKSDETILIDHGIRDRPIVIHGQYLCIDQQSRLTCLVGVSLGHIPHYSQWLCVAVVVPVGQEVISATAISSAGLMPLKCVAVAFV